MRLDGMRLPVSFRPRIFIQSFLKQFPRYFLEWSLGFAYLSIALPISLRTHSNASSSLVADLPLRFWSVKFPPLLLLVLWDLIRTFEIEVTTPW